jgi:cyclophilin family peptidyl-prolyl cis-trans isomerase
MSSLPERQILARRRARRAAATAGVAEAPAPAEPVRIGALLTLALTVAVVVAIGIGLQAALLPKPIASLSRCHAAQQLGPHRYAAAPAMCIDVKKTYIAHIDTTKGRIDIALDAAGAPITVNNFVVLGISGFYNGLTFWQVQDWMVQGGDPNGDGTGGPGYTLPDEPLKAGNTWSASSVGMARFLGGRVNGSQFFILKNAWPGSGPGDVAFNRFGTMLGGTDIAGTLAAGDRIVNVSVSQQ